MADQKTVSQPQGEGFEDVDELPQDVVGASYFLAFGTYLRGVAVTPYRNVKTLIQLGYEPIPEAITSGWGGTSYRLPGAWAYGKHLKRTVGWSGLFLGMHARGCEELVCMLARAQAVTLVDGFLEGAAGEEKSKQLKATLPRRVAFNVTVGCMTVIAAHPFKVAGNRMAAQIVEGGVPVLYRGTWQTIVTILKEEGVGGLYAGLAPALVAEATLVVMGSIFARLLTNAYEYIMEQPVDVKSNVQQLLIGAAASAFAGPFYYPFLLSSTLMSVQGTSLAIAHPPISPEFGSWTDAMRHNYQVGGWNASGLMRGSSILRRVRASPFPKNCPSE